MDEENIKLPTSLMIIVANELRDKYGIDKWKESANGRLSNNFTKEELAKIEELKFSKEVYRGFLDGIDKLPNLRSLHVETSGRDVFTQPRNLSTIGDKDIASIEKCENLESLTIIGQFGVTCINLSRLPKLKSVNISSNYNLESIYGLDRLQQLESLTCCGNESVTNIDRLDKAIINNQSNLRELNLDVLLFPSAIGYNPATGGYNQIAFDVIRNIDSLSLLQDLEVGPISICLDQMIEMHNKACEILENNVPLGASTMDSIVAVEKYLAENVAYDYDSIGNNNTSVDGSGVEYGANSSYNCLVTNKCVCEGYTRGEQYLLGLRGIRTRNVLCFGEKDNLGLSDTKNTDNEHFRFTLPDDGYHSIVCFSDYYNLYSDPCWNAAYYQQRNKSFPYLFMTKEEISKDHTLGFSDIKVQNDMTFYYRSKAVQDAIERNKFALNKDVSGRLNEARSSLYPRGAVRFKVNNKENKLDSRGV